MAFLFRLCKAFLKVKDQWTPYFAIMFFFGFFNGAMTDILKLSGVDLERIEMAIVLSMFFGYLLITLPLELIKAFIVDSIEKKSEAPFEPIKKVGDMMSGLSEEDQLFIYEYAFQVREDARADSKRKRLARRQNNHSFFFQRVWLPVENFINKSNKEITK